MLRAPANCTLGEWPDPSAAACSSKPKAPLRVCHPWVFGCLRRRLAAAAKQATEIEAPNLRDLGSGRRAEASSPDNRVGGGANRSRPRAYTKLAWVRASRFPDAEFGGVLLEAGSATHDRG